MEARRAKELVSSLIETWTLTVGKPPRDLADDLQTCRRWFDPVAQGQRLRRELSALPELPLELEDPGEPLIAHVGVRKRIVTPEGRCALDLLQALPPLDESYTLSELQLVGFDRLLGSMYRDWSRHRIQSVVGLLAGTTNPLQVPAAGVVIALLVNRCTSEDRALVRYVADTGRHVVDRAFFVSVNAFADVLAPSRRGKRDQRLISGWMLYEARRRLGDSLVLLEARGGHDGKVWIRSDAEDEVIKLVARDLARGHRVRATPQRFGAAFDSLVNGLRQEMPGLAGFGMAHERPANTARLRQRIMTELAAHVDPTDDPGSLPI
ncbi:MAG: hypothetical protein ACREX3_18235 [Gammaproteobacteria bacterium]